MTGPPVNSGSQGSTRCSIPPGRPPPTCGTRGRPMSGTPRRPGSLEQHSARSRRPRGRCGCADSSSATCHSNGATTLGTGPCQCRMNTMHAERRTAAVLLAVLYAVSGALCLFAAAWPMRPDTPVHMLWVLGVVGTVGALSLRLLAGRLPWWALHLAVLLASVLVALLAERSATAVGIV